MCVGNTIVVHIAITNVRHAIIIEIITFAHRLKLVRADIDASAGDSRFPVQVLDRISRTVAEEWIARLMEAQTKVWLANAASVRLYDSLRSDPVTNSLVDEGDKRIVDLYCEGFKQFCPHITPSRRRPMGRALLIMSYALHEDVFFAATPRERQARIREIYPAMRSYVCGERS